jgi:tRNA dimethylallyltransferase
LNIGVAKPSKEELNQVQHFFIDSHSIFDTVNAGVFEQYALLKSVEIFKENEVAVMVGGTGLYVNAFCNGIDEMPTVDEAIRQIIKGTYQEKGLLWLQTEVAKLDNDFWQVSEQQNPQRLMRALEIKMATGKSITEFKKNKAVERPFEILKIGLETARENLIDRINRRVDIMINEGLVEEVEQLLQYKNWNALQTVGYSELFDYFEKKRTLKEAIESIKIHTRQYAKRQMTWFKKDTSINWINDVDSFDMSSFLHKCSSK